MEFKNALHCSTPSRICLFGEHQDYLGLEVITMAINLRFSGIAEKRTDGLVVIDIRDDSCGDLDYKGESMWKRITLSLNEGELPYEYKRDYMRSVFNVLRRRGYDLSCGFTMQISSTIPIGKGMSSSSAMIIILIQCVLTTIGSKDASNPKVISDLAFDCEVTEFSEPGGKMDHISTCYGGLVHMYFGNPQEVVPLDFTIPGSFVLIDSLQRKDTLKVLASSKTPTVEAVSMLGAYGVTSLRDLIENPEKQELLSHVDDFRRQRLVANLKNYAILKEGRKLLSKDSFDPVQFGKLLYDHHCQLRDGLGISTDIVEDALNVALKAGGLGGKINGSGGGGCLYVYCRDEDALKIKTAVDAAGYKSMVIKCDSGVRLD